jgi:membrane-bound lytic murein transglycosylase D
VAFLVCGVFLARFSRILILSLPVLAACAKAVPTQVVKAVPPTLPPHREQHVDPLVAPIPTQLPKLNFNDPIDKAILEAQLRFKRGENFYQNGFLKQAKQEFDSAVDLILDTAETYPKDPRLRQELTDLVGLINAMELEALREGDGFTDQKQEHAAIDDLEHVETFPALIDPKLKKEVEEDVSEITHDLPIEINDRVLGLLNYYQNGRGRSVIEVGSSRPDIPLPGGK